MKILIALVLMTTSCDFAGERITESTFVEMHAMQWMNGCERGAGIISDRPVVYQRKKYVSGHYEEWLVSSWRSNLIGSEYCEALCLKSFGEGCPRWRDDDKYITRWFRYVFDDGLLSWVPEDMRGIAKRDRKMVEDIRRIYDKRMEKW